MDGDAALILGVFVMLVVFHGEPDLIDAIIYWLMK